MNLPALVALMVLAHTAFAGGRVALTLAAIRLGGTPLEVGLVVSLLALVPMCLAVHAGRWSDRSGAVRPALAALAMLCAGLLLASLPALASLGLSAILLGSGFMLLHLAIHNAVGKGFTSDERVRGFSLLSLGNSASTIAGPVIAGFLLDLAGPAWTFLVLAILPVLALAVLGRLRTALAAVPVSAPAAGKARVADLVRHAPLRAVLIVSALLSMGWDLFTFMMPMHGDRIGLSASTIGLVMGAFGVGTFVVRLFIPRLARSFAEWQVLAGALALSAAVYAVFPFFSTLMPLLALAFTLGLALGCAFPMIMSAIAHTAPPGRSGEAIGIRSMLINASQTLLPVTLGALGAAGGTRMAFWVIAAMLGAGMVFALVRHRT
ncbi:MFS transporter [Massilia sp. LjRoot122]|uniref:MFS transporter n=1 Tax=Massilia sp. LjRoot122 TaxID=3342257 RepID=UPI003ED11287